MERKRKRKPWLDRSYDRWTAEVTTQDLASCRSTHGLCHVQARHIWYSPQVKAVWILRMWNQRPPESFKEEKTETLDIPDSRFSTYLGYSARALHVFQKCSILQNPWQDCKQEFQALWWDSALYTILESSAWVTNSLDSCPDSFTLFVLLHFAFFA